MDGQFTQDAAVLRNAIKELKMRAGAIGPETTGLSQFFQSKKDFTDIESINSLRRKTFELFFLNLVKGIFYEAFELRG